MLLEVCVDTVLSARNAAEGGCDRIELCSSLKHGGLTPSSGVLQTVAAMLRKRVSDGLKKVCLMAMVRPRPGDFTYDDEEVRSMLLDVEGAARDGADGVVFGALTSDGKVDEGVCRLLLQKCDELGLDVTFHRAFDFVHDANEALDTLSALGIPRVLTSGGRSNAFEGLVGIRNLLERSAGGGLRVKVMAGGGINASNVKDFVSALGDGYDGLLEVHGSFKTTVTTRAGYSWRADPDKTEFGQWWASGLENVRAASGAISTNTAQ